MRDKLWLLLALAAVFASFPAQAAVRLVEGGKARAVIVVPSKAPQVVRYAAEELQGHIEKASGAKLPIVAETDAATNPGARIYLGDCRASRDAGIDSDSLALETCVLRAKGNAIFVAGRDQDGDPLEQSLSAGTLFGVYELLETSMGVRWLWPGELGEVVPKTDTIVVKDTDRTVKPKFVQRWIRTTQEWHADRREEMVWLRRHRMGRSQFLYPSHAFRNWWDRYGKDHPEYFNLLPNGKREPFGLPSEVSMCVSEPALWKQFVKNWLEMPEISPGVRPLIDCSESDGVPLCTCERCRSWDVGEVKVMKSEMVGADGKVGPIEYLSPVSDRYARFWLSVQQEAAKHDPQATVIALAYSSYTDPPLKAKLNDHIIVGIVADMPFPETRESVGKSRHTWKGWADTGARLYLRPNYFLQGYCMPYVFAETFGREFGYAARNGMIGTDFDALTGMYATQGPTLYLLARMHNRPLDNPARLLDEYYGGFGPAAKQVRGYFDYWGGISTRLGPKLPSWPYWPKSVQDLYNAEDFTAAERLLASAKAACRNDQAARARVEFLAKGLTNARLTFEAAQAVARDSASGDKAGRGSALARLTAFRKTIERDYVANLGYLRWSESIFDWYED